MLKLTRQEERAMSMYAGDKKLRKCRCQTEGLLDVIG